MKLYTVQDVKTNTYINPFPCPSERDAVDQFSEIANDKTHQMGKFPEDFTMYELAEFDQRSGKIIVHDEPRFISHAHTLVKKYVSPDL